MFAFRNTLLPLSKVMVATSLEYPWKPDKVNPFDTVEIAFFPKNIVCFSVRVLDTRVHVDFSSPLGAVRVLNGCASA